MNRKRLSGREGTEMLRRIREKLKQKKASSMLECVIVIPLWTLVMFSIIDFSAYVNARWDCMAISRATVRAGSLKMIKDDKGGAKANDDYMKNVFDQMAKSMLSSGFATVSRKEVKSGKQEGDVVYTKTCVNVQMTLPQIWGEDTIEVCEDYVMLRTFKGTMT
jgi:hypothetical protein